MAVQFPDASNRCSWGPPIGTTGAQTFAFWINPAGSGNIRIVDANASFVLADGTTGINYQRSYALAVKECVLQNAWTFGTLVHIVITDDGTTNASGIVGYANGSVLTHEGGADVNGSGTAETDDGCQLGHATIAFPCTMSELAVWHRVLSANEIASLSTGRCSPLYFPNGLRMYAPMWDIVTTAGLREQVNNLTATIATAGIVKAAHPRIHYPANPQLAAAFTAASGISAGLATETDTALARTLSKALTTGLATETDTALARTLSRQVAAGLAAETDTAFARTLSKRLTVGLAAETDSALTRTLSKNVAPGLSAETDTALARTLSKALAPGVSTETDTALGRTLSKRGAVGLATETDTAFALGLTSGLVAGLATETDTALACTLSKRVSVGLATEIDTAFTLDVANGLAPGVAVETDSSLSCTLSKRVAVGLATETDTALARPLSKRLSAGVSVETSTALSRALSKVLAPGRATETDTALARMFHLRPGLATETDLALALALTGGPPRVGTIAVDVSRNPTLAVGVVPMTADITVSVEPLA